MSIEQRGSKRFAGQMARDRMGGSLVNVILGALILWVGQTTFQHAEDLSRFNERLGGIGRRLDQTTANTLSRFTQEHGEKISQRVDEVNDLLTDVRLQVNTLEARGSSVEEMTTLRAEVERLRTVVAQRSYPTHVGYSNDLRLGERPVHLPPTTRQ